MLIYDLNYSNIPFAILEDVGILTILQVLSIYEIISFVLKLPDFGVLYALYKSFKEYLEVK